MSAPFDPTKEPAPGKRARLADALDALGLLDRFFWLRARLDHKTLVVLTYHRIGDPASYDRAVAAIRETNGVVAEVTDAEILEAKSTVDRAGIGCEPASAASVAGARRLVREGTIGPRDRVVAVLTGHVLKDPDTLLRGSRLTEIEPSLSALEAALRQTG